MIINVFISAMSMEEKQNDDPVYTDQVQEEIRRCKLLLQVSCYFSKFEIPTLIMLSR